MVSTRPPTSKFSSPFSNPLVTVPNAPITIGIIVTCIFHSFFNSLARSRYLSFFSHSFSFILWSAGTGKSTILQVLSFLLILLQASFLHYRKQMLFHWSLRDKFLLDVLDSSSNFQFFRSPYQAFWDHSKCCELQLISLLLSCSPAFWVLWQVPRTCLSFRFLWFWFSGLPDNYPF